MKEILKNKGYKATPARLAILDILKESKAPISVEKLYKLLKSSSKTKNINEATVYRTLTSLEGGNIIIKVNLGKSISFFELPQKHHHHITCIKCDTIEDFENKEVEKILDRVGRNSSNFKSIKSHSLEIFGFCKKCTV